VVRSALTANHRAAPAPHATEDRCQAAREHRPTAAAVATSCGLTA